MANQKSKNQKPQFSQRNLILLIIAAIAVIAVCVFAVITVVNTIRSDNPSSTAPSGSETGTTVDAAAEGEKLRNTIALTLGDHSLNAVELNYFYMETVNKFCSDYYYYIYYFGMIDTSTPLNEQYYDEESGTTWADYLLTATEENIKSTYLLCDLAAENGITLSQDDQEYLDTIRETIEYYAEYYQYSDVNSYLVDFFGYGSDIDSYLAYCERSLLADACYNQYAESLEYSNEDLRTYEADKMHQYNAYSYATYYLSASKFLTGGTEDSDGNITYTDEQIAASIQAAADAAAALDGSSCESLDAFNELILSMEINAALDSVSITEKSDLLYAKIDSTYQEWITSADRVYGDVTIFAKTSTDSETEEEVVDGYYIIWFGGVNDNNFALKDVRHLLVMFKDADGKTYADNVTSFTDEQKAAAKAEAEELLEQWKAGDADEDSFIQLVMKHSEDNNAATGGLYTEIYPGQMVENFEAWCYEDGRQFGDTGLVESPYGYHVMFFVGDSDITYRDYMIAYEMRSADLNEWHTDLVESVELIEVCLDYCALDMKLSG